MHEINTENDLKEVKRITDKIIGELCWNVYLGYAEELKLDCGEKVLSGPKLKREFEGVWFLGNSSNYWELYYKGEEIPVGHKEENEISEELRYVNNTTIIGFDISYPELVLTISFSNDYQLKLFPEDDEYNLPYWELFTPDNMVIEFGPNRKWSYERSDTPPDEDDVRNQRDKEF